MPIQRWSVLTQLMTDIESENAYAAEQVDLECPAPFGLFAVCDGHGENGHIASQVLIEVVRQTTKEAKSIRDVEDLTRVIGKHIEIAENILGSLTLPHEKYPRLLSLSNVFTLLIFFQVPMQN